MTGEVMETVDARTLFRKVAKAAWECADPGIQYDGTINDWHTNPESGRITASNPCTRVPQPGQLLLQPGQLNLLKFLARRRHVRRWTGSPRWSSWSSPRWTSRSRSRTSRPRRSARPPGLTASSASATPTSARCSWRPGTPMTPTAAGRIAAAITSLMTGTAYRRSAELAAVVGPYEGYARNADRAHAGDAQARRCQPTRSQTIGANGRRNRSPKQIGLGQRPRPRRGERLAQRAGAASWRRPAPSA